MCIGGANKIVTAYIFHLLLTAFVFRKIVIFRNEAVLAPISSSAVNGARAVYWVQYHKIIGTFFAQYVSFV